MYKIRLATIDDLPVIAYVDIDSREQSEIALLNSF